ncbi:MAG: hypothetical protein ABSE50_24325 [Xanthobacteraceae bacterium]
MKVFEMQRPGLRSDEAREREEYIQMVKFHRAHVIEITYFCVLAAAALLIISLFVDPDWAWFLRGGIGGLVLTFFICLGQGGFICLATGGAPVILLIRPALSLHLSMPVPGPKP